MATVSFNWHRIKVTIWEKIKDSKTPAMWQNNIKIFGVLELNIIVYNLLLQVNHPTNLKMKYSSILRKIHLKHPPKYSRAKWESMWMVK